jgi:hypothetical protein
MNKSQFRDVSVESPDGQSLCALINGDCGWLMYLRHRDGDPGFSSRNPNYTGSCNATIEYVLSNGQVDEYPASWAYPTAEVERALEFFRKERVPPPFIRWHNDSDDGVALEYQNV